MRLQSFLNEDSSRDYDKYLTDNKDMIVNRIKGDCGKWLKDMGGHPVYRGLKGNDGKETFIRKTVRKDRYPLDVSPTIHDASDIIFKDLFGWKARSEALFVSKAIGQASSYGARAIYNVFPIGDFKYIYTDNISDFYVIGDMIDTLDGGNYGLSKGLKDKDPETMEELRLKIKEYYHDNGLKNSEWISGEIMVRCDDYYGIKIPYSVSNEPYLSIMKELGIDTGS